MRPRCAAAMGAHFSCGRAAAVMVTGDTPLTMSSSAGRSLTSWKEIAHHLGVNVRTAQKWEREKKLPVRRGSGARSRVSADTASLDAWKLQQHAHVTDNEDRCYRWPLGPGVTVEVRILGDVALASTHIDLFREYLELFKNALR